MSAIANNNKPQASLQMNKIRSRLLRKLSWTPEKADRVIEEYGRFFHLMATKKGARLVPSNEVDEVWHAHILHTAIYTNDCLKNAGRFIHHHPTEPSEATEDEDRSSYLDTLRLYEEEFGEAPSAEVWPREGTTRDGDDCSSIRCRSQCPSCNADCSDDDSAARARFFCRKLHSEEVASGVFAVERWLSKTLLCTVLRSVWFETADCWIYNGYNHYAYNVCC